MITREYLKSLEFKPFDDAMWEGFCGCQTPIPFYAEDGEEFIIILDGGYCEVYDSEMNQVDCVDNIADLPY